MREIDLKILACLNYISKMLGELTFGLNDIELAHMRRKLGQSLIELAEVMGKDNDKE